MGRGGERRGESCLSHLVISQGPSQPAAAPHLLLGLRAKSGTWALRCCTSWRCPCQDSLIPPKISTVLSVQFQELVSCDQSEDF